MDDNNTQQTTEVHEQNVVTDNGTNVQRQTIATQTAATADNRVVASRVIWYIAGFIIALLALRIIMFLLGANQGSPFVDFLYALSSVFAWPFTGIFPTPAYGVHALDTASLVGIVIYALVAWGVGKLITINRPAGTTDVQ